MPSDFTVLHKLTAMVTYLLRRSKYEAIVHTLEQSAEKKNSNFTDQAVSFGPHVLSLLGRITCSRGR